MKNLLLPMVLFTISFLLSCQSGQKTEVQVEEPIPASSIKVMMIRHPVSDFDAWKPHYMAHDSMRAAYGMTHFSLSRGMDNPNMVLIANRIDDVQKAKDFSMMPELKAVMDSAGVTGPPTIEFAELVRYDTSTVSMRDRVIISHRVKDFDTWLKAYDNEGRKTRREHGLVDRGLARGIDDPNLVYVIFAVTDMEKAKARANSEELKTLMTEAGVESAPEVFWYTAVD